MLRLLCLWPSEGPRLSGFISNCKIEARPLCLKQMSALAHQDPTEDGHDCWAGPTRRNYLAGNDGEMSASRVGILHIPEPEESEVRCNRITESLRLEKTSKIIKSNCQPNTTMPTKSWPKMPYLHF